MVLNTTGSSRADKAARYSDWSQITLTASQTVQVGRLDIMAEPLSGQTKKLVERGIRDVRLSRRLSRSACAVRSRQERLSSLCTCWPREDYHAPWRLRR